MKKDKLSQTLIEALSPTREVTPVCKESPGCSKERLKLCIDCGNPSPTRPTCDDCMRAKILALYLTPREQVAAAQRVKLSEIWGDCPQHGFVLFSTSQGGFCLQCRAEKRQRTPRAEARRRGRHTYKEYCAVHGLTDHSVGWGKCLKCFTTAGAPRGGQHPHNPIRVAARHAGHKSFLARCERHGDTAHSTAHGKCLTCYNATGYARPAVPDSA